METNKIQSRRLEILSIFFLYVAHDYMIISMILLLLITVVRAWSTIKILIRHAKREF